MSRGMANKAEVLECNPDLVGVTEDQLTKEMSSCEAQSCEDVFSAPVEEVLTVPDPLRTSFLWQVQSQKAQEGSLQEWEGEEQDEDYLCLPGHWQTILNGKLAEFHAKIQDAEALWRHRQQEFGDQDIKTKNSLKKFEAIQAGEGSQSIILISKATGKEAGPDVYARSLNKVNGAQKVLTTNKTQAYQVDMQSLTLQLLHDGEVNQPAKKLRLVSVTGMSREIQELRIHLDALSLSTSHVLDGLSGHGHEGHDFKAKAKKAEEVEGRACHETTYLLKRNRAPVGRSAGSAYWGVKLLGDKK